MCAYLFAPQIIVGLDMYYMLYIDVRTCHVAYAHHNISQELRQQNALLLETKVLLEEELTGLHAKLETLGDTQAENAAFSVRVESLEAEINEEELRMQELLQHNVQLEMSKDSK